MARLSSLLAAALLVAPLLIAAPAAAQGLSVDEIGRRFAAFDGNGDGKISKEEYELNKVVAIFDPRERSGAASTAAGRIDRDVAISHQTSRLNPQVFATLDVNGDGTLSGGEIIASDMMQFESIDRNGDGFIDRPEFNALVDRLFR
jgi:Ca2+-binding EF-hand superfamily protein